MTQLTTWVGLHASRQTFAQRTFGWGTTAERDAITTWNVLGWFLDTDTNVLYQNSGTEIAVIWSPIILDERAFISNVVALGG